MSSRRHRERASSSKKDDYRNWATDTDHDRHRYASATTGYRTAQDNGYSDSGYPKPHRSSRRTEATTAEPSTSAYTYKTSSRDQNHPIASASSSNPTVHSYGSVVPPGPQPVLTASRMQEPHKEVYGVHTFLKKSSEKRHSPSSDEKVLVAETTKAPRSSQQTRVGYPNPTAAVAQAPSSTQTYWIPPQAVPSETVPSKRHKDRDREKDRDKEKARERERDRERREREKDKQRREREKEKIRLKEEQQARDYEKERERERQRRHEEKETKRLEKEYRRQQEKAREPNAQRRHETQGGDHPASYNIQPQITKVTRSTQPIVDDRASTRQQTQHYHDQYPSSSQTNVLSSATHPSPIQPITIPSRQQHKDDYSVPQSAPPTITVDDQKRHRTRKDRAPSHQYGQESGMSGSEQEHSGRERAPRIVDRKYVGDHNMENNPSGPSGSETERSTRERERRKHGRYASESRALDPAVQARNTPFTAEASRLVVDARQQPPNVTSSYGSVPASIPVGPTTFTPYAPQLVSIRAGQGPADPQMISPYAKTTTPSVSQSRANDPRAPQSSSLHAHDVTHAAVNPVSQRLATTQTAPSHPSSQYAPASGTHAYISQPAAPSVPLKAHETQSGFNNHHINLQPTIRPPSTAPVSSSNGHSIPSQHLQSNARSYTDPTPHSSNIPHFTPKQSDLPPLPPNIGSSHVAQLSVYRSPDPPVSAELVVSAYPNATKSSQSRENVRAVYPKGSTHDLSSRFPLNEDSLPPVSVPPSQGVNDRTGIPTSYSGNSQQPRTTDSTYAASQHGTYPNRAATYPQPANGHAVGSYSPPKPGSIPPSRTPMPGEDTPRAAPLPIPEPRMRLLSNQQISAAGPNQSTEPYDPRSPKHNLVAPAPIMSSSPFQSSRPQVSPLQPRSSTLPTTSDAGLLRPPSRSAVPTTIDLSASSHSPSRHAQLNVLRSPGTINAASLGPSTPKHSPSGRLKLRNGSNDTITQPHPAKYSPTTIPTKSLNHRISLNSVQPQTNAPSRNDTNSVNPNIMARPSAQQTSSGYPDPTRYRSPPPTTTAYPSYSQQQQPVPASTTYPVNPTSVNLVSTNVRSTIQQVAHSTTMPAGHEMSRDAPNSASQATSAQSTAAAIAAAYRSGTYQTEFGYRQPDSSAHSISQSQRNPSRTMPSSASASIAAPQPIRGQTFPAPSVNRAGVSSHSRTVSDPQHGSQSTRVAISGHPSTPAPSKTLLATTAAPTPPTDQELLRTPSSLAASNLLRGNSLTGSTYHDVYSHARDRDRDRGEGGSTKPPSVTPSKEKEARKKGGFFGLFRSRSSPPKQAEVRPPVLPTGSTGKTRPRAGSQSTVVNVVKNIVTPHPTDIHPRSHARKEPSIHYVDSSRQIPTTANGTDIPIVAPKPIHAAPNANTNSGRKSPSGKMFTPFRLLSRKNRTISAASVEALDGTAPNTVIGGESTRSSTAGRPSPPLRDPMVATVDWRDRGEADLRDRGTLRRYRPGVVFDVVEDLTEEVQPRPSRESRRPSRR